MTQALYAHMNNKRKMKNKIKYLTLKKKRISGTSLSANTISPH
jgi:hypothetical protein